MFLTHLLDFAKFAFVVGLGVIGVAAVACLIPDLLGSNEDEE